MAAPYATSGLWSHVPHFKKPGPLRRAAPAQSARRRTRLRVDAARGVAHRVRNGLAKTEGGKRNARTDDRQDQRIFSGRSTGLVLQHVDESLHVLFLHSSTSLPSKARVSRFAWIGEMKRAPRSRCQMEPSKVGSQLVAPRALSNCKGCDSVNI